VEFILFAGLASFISEKTGGNASIVVIEDGTSIEKLLEGFHVLKRRKRLSS